MAYKLGGRARATDAGRLGSNLGQVTPKTGEMLLAACPASFSVMDRCKGKFRARYCHVKPFQTEKVRLLSRKWVREKVGHLDCLDSVDQPGQDWHWAYVYFWRNILPKKPIPTRLTGCPSSTWWQLKTVQSWNEASGRSYRLCKPTPNTSAIWFSG